jgi:hypothetical protein
MVTATKLGGIGGVSVTLLPASQPMPKQNGRLAVLDSLIKRQTPFVDKSVGLTATSPIVPDPKYNYANWLALNPYVDLSTLRELVDSEPVRVNVIDDWFQLIDYNDPFPEYGYDWRPFFALRSYIEEGAKTPKEWLDKLQAMTQEEMNDLEAVQCAFFQGNQTVYSGMTAGVRLLRAALRQCADKKVESFELPVDQLVDPARDDLVAFFKGNYVWSSYVGLLHPQNQAKVGKAVLVVKVDRTANQPMLIYSLRFPPEVFKFDQYPVIEFKVPIAVETPKAQ